LSFLEGLLVLQNIVKSFDQGVKKDNLHQANKGVLDSIDSVIEGVAEVLVMEYNMGFKDLYNEVGVEIPAQFA
jgi:hypothetical protein